MTDPLACYCSEYQSSGLPCPPGKCPNVPKKKRAIILYEGHGEVADEEAFLAAGYVPRSLLTAAEGRLLELEHRLKALADKWWETSQLGRTVINLAGVMQTCAGELRAALTPSEVLIGKDDAEETPGAITAVQLSEKERHVLEHTTGWKSADPLFRNHFVASAGHDDWSTLLVLCRRGLMRVTREPSELSDGGVVFGATEAGIDALRQLTTGKP